jgi:hypothetical protein
MKSKQKVWKKIYENLLISKENKNKEIRSKKMKEDRKVE